MRITGRQTPAAFGTGLRVSWKFAAFLSAKSSALSLAPSKRGYHHRIVAIKARSPSPVQSSSRLLSTKDEMEPLILTNAHVNTNEFCRYDSPFLSEPTGSAQNALIILNTPIQNPPSVLFQSLWELSSFRVCADGGANRLYDATDSLYVPDAISGDLDSLRQDVRDKYEEKGALVEEDSDQNSNDLDKSLQLVHSKRKEIWTTDDTSGRVFVYGGFGGRFDQEMGCIQALFTWSSAFQYRLVLFDDKTCAFLIRPVVRNEIRVPFYGDFPGNEREGAPDDLVGEGPTCGLIPIGHRCEFAHTSGLKWNLDGCALEFGGMVSTSNRVMEEVVIVQASHPLVFTAEMTAGCTSK